MKHRLFILFALAALGTAQARAMECPAGRDLAAGLPTAVRDKIDADARQDANGEGKLYRIERPGISASHLYGTLHLSDSRVTTLPPRAEAAFDKAGEVVIETTDLLDQTKVSAALLARPDLMNVPAGKRMADYVAPDELGRLQNALADAGVPPESVRSLQPWVLTMSLLMPACETQRLAAGKAILDIELATRAQDRGKTLSGLESAEEQLEAIASLPLRDQAEMLLSTLTFRTMLPDLFETMTLLYLDGRIAAITPTLEAIAPTGSDDARSIEIWQAFEEVIVHRRNHVMVERLTPKLSEGGLFVAVGAQHLIGDEGLVELLRRNGWSVNRVD